MPPPMPAALLPPTALIVPDSIRILPGGGKPPGEPIPAADGPPMAVRLPVPDNETVALEQTWMPEE